MPTTWLAVWIRPPGLSQGEGLGLGGPGWAARRATSVPSRAEGPSSGDCRAGGLVPPGGPEGKAGYRCAEADAGGLVGGRKALEDPGALG